MLLYINACVKSTSKYRICLPKQASENQVGSFCIFPSSSVLNSVVLIHPEIFKPLSVVCLLDFKF